MGPSSFIVVAVVASQICEILRHSSKIRTYDSSRPSKVIDLGANRKRICNFLLVISNNFECISYVYEILNAFFSKYLVFPSPPLFDAQDYSGGTL